MGHCRHAPPEGGCPVKTANFLIYAASFLCFLLFLFVGSSFLTAFGCIPFFILLCTSVHELGHCAGCLLTGSKIRKVQLPLFTVEESHFRINSRISPVSCCSFQKSSMPWLVYLMGPLFSLLLFGLSLWVCLASPNETTTAGCILAFTVLAVNIVPYKRNDMSMFLREILLRNENDS